MGQIRPSYITARTFCVIGLTSSALSIAGSIAINIAGALQVGFVRGDIVGPI